MNHQYRDILQFINQSFMFFLSTGLGFGLVYAACITQTTCNVSHWRALANGISTSGGGLGTVVMPLVGKLLINKYGWRGALLITAALTLHICFYGFIMRLFETTAACKNLDREDFISVAQMEEPFGEGFSRKDWRKDRNIKKFKLLRNPLIWSLHLNTFFFCFGQSIVFAHLAAFAVKKGFNIFLASSFISVLGFAGIVGRILIGIICNAACIDVHLLNVGLNVLAGLSILGLTMWDVYIGMVILVALTGIAFSTFGPVYCELTYNIFGLEGFSKGYGILLISMAVGTILGAPCAGKLYDWTTLYSNSFYLASVTLFLAATIYGVVYLADKKLKEVL